MTIVGSAVVGEPDLNPHWAPRIERALTGAGVRAVYQPIVDLQRRSVVGFEALTRFEDPDGLVATPDVWFAAAHELGQSEDLELITLAAALAHRADLPTNCFMTVNLEPESLLSPRIRSVLAAQGNLGSIVVEITEHRRLDIEALEGPLNWLRGAGALIAVDDAGAGYAGLQAILDLRPSILKLDRSLVEGIDADETKAALAEMMGLFANRIDAQPLSPHRSGGRRQIRSTRSDTPVVRCDRLDPRRRRDPAPKGFVRAGLGIDRRVDSAHGRQRALVADRGRPPAEHRSV